MSLALYRKYRPQSFDAIVGQSHVVDVFRNAARQQKIAHAYIFYGPRGTGKTTMARLVAEAANCLSLESIRATGEPCNKCRVCEEINEGRAMDVIEIDAASNRGIDEIRNLRESIRFSPSSYTSKVFIIDEAHMLTRDACNALLKTLEEPPAHAIIILATTEYERILPTITSRAQRFHFKRLSVAEISKKLKDVAEREKLTIHNDALELIAVAAEGGLRDAESLLDQVTSLADNADVESVENIIGKVGSRRVVALADILINGNLSAALKFLADLHAAGANVTDLNKELIVYLRRVLALHFDQKLEELFRDEVTKDELHSITVHSKKIDSQKIINLLKSIIRAYSEMRYSPFPHVPLEVAIIENLSSN